MINHLVGLIRSEGRKHEPVVNWPDGWVVIGPG